MSTQDTIEQLKRELEAVQQDSLSRSIRAAQLSESGERDIYGQVVSVTMMQRIMELEAQLAAANERIAEVDGQLAYMKEGFRMCQDSMSRSAAHHIEAVQSYQAQLEVAARRIRLLEGALAADDKRMWNAAEKAGITYVGCDTPDRLVDALASARADASLRLLWAKRWLARWVKIARKLKAELHEAEIDIDLWESGEMDHRLDTALDTAMNRLASRQRAK